MDYGDLLQRAWRLTWRHRFLWVLGLFVPGPTASCSANLGGNGLGEALPTGGEATGVDTDMVALAAAIAAWLEQNLSLILALAGLIVLLALALFVVSIVAQGSMAHGTVALAQGRAISLGATWRLGLRDFWRYLGLWFLQLLATLGIVLVAVLPLGLLGGILYFLTGGDPGPAIALTLALVLFGSLLVLATVLIAVALSVAVALAQRSIAVEGLGPTASLRAGVALLRSRPGPVAFVWLLSVAIGIGAAIALAIAMLVLIVPLGLIGVALYAATGFAAVTIAYTVVALLLVIAASWAASAVVSTYIWHYWTLAYLALTGRLTDRLEVAQAVP